MAQSAAHTQDRQQQKKESRISMRKIRWIAWSWIILSTAVLFFWYLATKSKFAGPGLTTMTLIWMGSIPIWMLAAYTTALFTERPAWINSSEEIAPNVTEILRILAGPTVRMPGTPALSAPLPAGSIEICSKCHRLYAVAPASLYCSDCASPADEEKEPVEEKLRRVLDLRKDRS